MIPNNIKKILDKYIALEKEQAINKLIKETRISKLTAEKYYKQWKDSFIESVNVKGLAEDFKIVKIMVETKSGVFSIDANKTKTLKKKDLSHKETLLTDEVNLETVRKHLVENNIFGG